MYLAGVPFSEITASECVITSKQSACDSAEIYYRRLCCFDVSFQPICIVGLSVSHLLDNNP